MLDIHLLGPVEVRVSGVDVALSPLERNLLTLLSLTQGIALSTDRIIDQLWADRPPASPRSRVQGLISSLRRKIGDVLVTRHPGYLLDPTRLDLDVERCEHFAVRASAAGSTDEAVTLLRRALAVWRGEPLDGVTAPGADADRTRLAELRVGLLEARFDAELELGRHADVVGELAAAVAEHPLRERLAGQHMTALYRSNRRADALHAYQALRTRLADELGSDPCHDLRELHATILRGADEGPTAPAARPEHRAPRRTRRRRKNTPAQLPPGVGHFTGREAELGALTAASTEPTDEPRVLVVTAAAGLGKTALVVRWAHSVACHYPDGQVFLDLRGHDPRQALTPETALTAVLTAFGTSAKKMPTTLADLLATYRTLLYGRRVLIVADDVGSAGQLAALVPPTPEARLVATSRRRLSGLSTQHAMRELTLDPLPRDVARDLLRRILGPDRLHDPGIDDVLHWCGGWPLALRQAAAKLAARPGQPAASFLEELRAPSGGLVVDGDTRDVHSVLTETLRCVSPAAARLFERLRGARGGLSLARVAAAAETPVHDARELLDELVAAHLVIEHRSGRFQCHEVVGRFAAAASPGRETRAQLLTMAVRRPVVDSQRI